MTEEEYRAEQEERQRLVNQINSLVNQINRTIQENAQLEQELIYAANQVVRLIDNAGHMDVEVNEVMSYLSQDVGEAEVVTTDLFEALNELSRQYFTFKSLSTASKCISQFTDEYNTKFSYYNELRRITLGYVIGLDAHIVSSEALRKKVEKAYLQNTEYWLAYCISAVQLWASNEKEAAGRAVSKSLSINYFSACLFYLLINLRFARIDAAKKWYLNYLDKADMNSLGDEWKYLLLAYLSGAFGADAEFQSAVAKCFMNMLSQMSLTSVDLGKRFSSRAEEFARTFLHKTEAEFVTLKKTCGQYEELIQLLSDAEKNAIIAKYYNTVAEQEAKTGEDLPQRIENVLYSLINNYDDDEYDVVKKIKYNEAIISARGDLSAAQANFNSAYPSRKSGNNFADLLLQWIFSEDTSQTDIRVRRFSISMMKEHLIKGFEAFSENYRKKEKDKYDITIDECPLNCSEDDFEASRDILEKHYEKNKLKNMLKDKFILIFGGVCASALLLLIITAFFYNPITLVIGILSGLMGSFLFWRRIVDVENILKEKQRLGVNVLKRALDELKLWRSSYRQEDGRNADLRDALAGF